MFFLLTSESEENIMKKFTRKLMAIMACMAITVPTKVYSNTFAIDTEKTVITNSSTDTVTYKSPVYIDYLDYCEKQIGKSCWASCILSMIRYNNSVAGITLSDIYDRANRLCSLHLEVGDPIQTSAFEVTANYYLGTSFKSSILTDDELVNHLINKEPVIAIVHQAGNVYHCVVIYGCFFDENNNVAGYYDMNPTTGTTEIVFKDKFAWSASIYYKNLI